MITKWHNMLGQAKDYPKDSKYVIIQTVSNEFAATIFRFASKTFHLTVNVGNLPMGPYFENMVMCWKYINEDDEI